MSLLMQEAYHVCTFMADKMKMYMKWNKIMLIMTKIVFTFLSYYGNLRIRLYMLVDFEKEEF